MSLIDSTELKSQLANHGMVGLSDASGPYAVEMLPEMFDRFNASAPPMAVEGEEPRKPTRKERKNRAAKRERKIRQENIAIRKARAQQHEANRLAKLPKKAGGGVLTGEGRIRYPMSGSTMSVPSLRFSSDGTFNAGQ
jgi:hypothetical protein